MALNLLPCKEESQCSPKYAANMKQSNRALRSGQVNEHATAETEHLSKKKDKNEIEKRV